MSGVKLNTWSFSNGELLEGPTWKDNRPTYYIFYSHGLAPTPWTFWLDFKVCSLVMGSRSKSRVGYQKSPVLGDFGFIHMDR